MACLPTLSLAVAKNLPRPLLAPLPVRRPLQQRGLLYRILCLLVVVGKVQDKHAV